ADGAVAPGCPAAPAPDAGPEDPGSVDPVPAGAPGPAPPGSAEPGAPGAGVAEGEVDEVPAPFSAVAPESDVPLPGPARIAAGRAAKPTARTALRISTDTGVAARDLAATIDP